LATVPVGIIVFPSVGPGSNTPYRQFCSYIPGFEGKVRRKRSLVAKHLMQLWNDERGQDIAEYAVMLAVILVIVVGTIRLIGSNANNVFSEVGSSIQ
jgi:Flp pilus assembly pilin Flp